MTKKKNAHAAQLGRLGGKARAKALTPERRREIARLAGQGNRKKELDAKLGQAVE